MQRNRSARLFLLLTLSCLILGCVSLAGGTGTADGGGSSGGAEGTRPAGAPQGEARLVATFPSGAQVFLYSPQDNEVVSTDYVDVTGKAPAETVITLNDEIAVAGSDGIFTARVPLDAGLNDIMGVASELEGNEVFFSFVVVYEPEGE